jgi:hypothetical protein
LLGGQQHAPAIPSGVKRQYKFLAEKENSAKGITKTEQQEVQQVQQEKKVKIQDGISHEAEEFLNSVARENRRSPQEGTEFLNSDAGANRSGSDDFIETDSDSQSVQDETSLEEVITCKQYPQLATLPHRKICDGAGRASPVIYDASKAPKWFQDQVDLVRPLAQVLENIATPDVVQRIMAMDEKTWSDELFDELLQPAEEFLKTWLPTVTGQQADLSVPDGQPFRLNLLRQLSQLTHDEDPDGLVSEDGCTSHINAKVPFSGIWPAKKRGDLKFDPSRSKSCWGTNYVSMDRPDPTWVSEIDRLMEKEIQMGWVQELLPEEESDAVQGVLGVVDEGFRKCSEPCEGKCGNKKRGHKKCRMKLRIIFDASIIGLNYHILHEERQEMPSANEKNEILKYCRANDIAVASLKWDFSSAFRRVKIHKAHQKYFMFVYKGKKYKYTVLPFGYKLSPYYFSRHVGVAWRLLKKINCALASFHASIIYIDDGDCMFPLHQFGTGCVVTMLFLRLVKSPLAYEKTEKGTSVDWMGWDYLWEHEQDTSGITRISKVLVGPRDKKYFQMATALLLIVDSGEKTPFRLLDRFVHQLSWMSAVLPFIKPFTKRAHAAVNERRRALDKRAKNAFERRKLEESEWVWTYKFAKDIPVWAWALANRRNVEIKLPCATGTLFRTDAAGSSSTAGLGGWTPPPEIKGCENVNDLSGIKWFSMEFHRGEVPEFGDDIPQRMVSTLELLGHLMALVLFPPPDDRQMATELDSMVAMYCIQGQKAKSKSLLLVLRAFSWVALKNNVQITSKHIAGVLNDIADGLSRPRTHEVLIELLHKCGNQVQLTVEDIRAALKVITLQDVQQDLQFLRNLIETAL